MKQINYLGLLAVAAVVCWTSVETFRLWEATQQADASQQLQFRTAAKLETARAKQTQVAHVEASSSSSSIQK